MSQVQNSKVTLAKLLCGTMLECACDQTSRMKETAKALHNMRYERDRMAHINRLQRMSDLEGIQAPVMHVMHKLPRARRNNTVTLDNMQSSADHNPLVKINGIEAPGDMYRDFRIVTEKNVITIRCGNLIGQGSYNHIYEAIYECDNRESIDAVIKTPVLPAVPIDLMLESIIHMAVSELPKINKYFIHLHAVVSLPIDYWPGSELAVVMTRHPGRDFDDYMSQYKVNSIEVLAVLQQVAYALYLAQKEIGFMHRDLKADNILVLKKEDLDPDSRMDDAERKRLARDDVIEVNEHLSFKTYGFSVQLCDFGAARIQLPDDAEAFAVPILQVEDKFNEYTDLAHFVGTFVEDFEPDMRKYAPEAFTFLKEYSHSLLNKKRAQEDVSFYDICQKIKDVKYDPFRFITELQKFQETLVQSHPELLQELE